MSVSRPYKLPHPLYRALYLSLQVLRKCVPNLACLLCYQASHTPVCQWCEYDAVFFSQDARATNLLHRPDLAAKIRHAHYTRLYACGYYQWPFSTLIHQLKFQRKRAAATVLSGWFNTHVLGRRDRPLPDCLLPVPLHLWRQGQRLYNQATELARGIGGFYSIPVIEFWAVRREAGSQHQRNRHQRLTAARHAFRLSKDCLDKAIMRQPVNSVAIVDDVMTTGITVDVLAGMLKRRYPYLRIEVWVIAITPAPRRRRS